MDRENFEDIFGIFLYVILILVILGLLGQLFNLGLHLPLTGQVVNSVEEIGGKVKFASNVLLIMAAIVAPIALIYFIIKRDDSRE